MEVFEFVHIVEAFLALPRGGQRSMGHQTILQGRHGVYALGSCR
jgi:hypothetical protein